jgi:hypothetical protein
MRIAILLLTISALVNAAAQELPCITSVKKDQFDEHGHLKRPSIPANIKHLLPTGANVQLVVSLSSSDTLTIYEAGDLDPDTRLLLSRRGHPLTQFAI